MNAMNCVRCLLPVALVCLATIRAVSQPYGLDTRPAIGPFLNGTLPPSAPVISGTWSAVVAFTNLVFTNAVGLTHVPGTTRLTVWEREGRVYSFENNRGANAKTLVLDISNQCQGWDDSGLLGLAYHPGFASNRYVFVWYNYVTPGTVIGNPNTRPPTGTPNRNRLSRFTLDPAGVAVPGSETVFIDQNCNTVWHNGGGMFFHPVNGFLHVTNGDDSNGGNNQRIDQGLFSGVLRIDVDQRGGSVSHAIPRQPVNGVTANYYIPNDNPFVGQAGVLEEFFAIALRSPHRMTHDPVTDRIFIGDVGAGSREEISVIEPTDPPGLNFQWDRIEGLNGDLTPPYIGVNKRPILDYSHSEGFAVIGGYVYRGSEFAADLGGRYIFGDNGSKRIWVMNESTTPATKTLLATLPGGSGPNSGNDYTGLSSFGVDQAGELFMCQMSSVGGRIYKLQRGGPANQPLPALLSQTGAFADLATLTPATGLIPYDVSSPLWSDGAIKSRWLAIPTNTSIGFVPTGEWTFPAGSVFVKHFELSASDTDPSIRKRLETRLLVRDTNGTVYGATYKWRPDQTDADLLDNALTENVTISTAPVGTFTGADVGGPALSGSTTPFAGGYEIQAGGTDIWNASDQFHFAHQQRTGDFDVRTRVESLTRADLYTKAGLMVRESLAADARHVYALVFPSNEPRNNNTGGYEFQYRATTGGGSVAIYPAAPQPTVNFPNTWLRLKRQGDLFIAYSSADGLNWLEFARFTLDLPDTVYFGLAVTAHTAATRTTARFHLSDTRVQPWFFPGRQDCLACHTPQSGGVLGIKTRQSNRDLFFQSSGVTDNQLRTWNHIGLFSPAINEGAIGGYDQLCTVTDTNFSLEHRVKSYLDANCSQCHRPGGVQAFWDARFDTPLSSQNIINGPVSDTLGVTGAKVVVPANLTRSIMHKRVDSVAQFKMPPLARNVIDQDAVSALAQWINGLPPIPSTLPAPWQHADVGGVAIAGDATYSGGVFSVSGSGADIWDAADGFHYVYQTLNGDGEISARVSGVQNTDAWAKAGVMIREDLSAASTHAFMAITPGNGSAFQRRVVAGGFSEHTAGGFVSAPYWVRLVRVGDTFTGYFSATGSGWILVGSADIPMGSSVNVGLAVTAHNNSVINNSSLDNVVVSGGASNVPPSVVLTAPVTGAVFAEGTNILLAASASDTDGTVSKVEFFRGATKLGEDNSASASLVWSNVSAGSYSLTAVATDNLGATTVSAPVSISVIGAPGTNGLISINFQTTNSITPVGYLEDVGFAYGDRGGGYAFGWDIDNTVNARDREAANSPDQRYDTLNHLQKPGGATTWELAIPNGQYRVRVVSGDPSNFDGYYSIAAEGVVILEGQPTAVNLWLDATATVTVADGRLTLGNGAAGINNKLCFVEVSLVSTSTPPVVALTAPANNASFTAPASIVIAATATNSSGAITRVEFFAGANKLGEDTTAPYQITWSNVVAGAYALTARATDNLGGSATSPAITVNVAPLVILVSSELTSAGQFRLWFTSPDSQMFLIEASTDLNAWNPIETNSPVGGQFEFVEVDPTTPHRFYRVKTWP